MKTSMINLSLIRTIFIFTLISSSTSPLLSAEIARSKNTIILNEQSVKNLKLQFAEASERDFETTFFAIGRMEATPTSRSVLSSRIAGRIIKLNAFEGDFVEKGQVMAEVESRQPGSPPPVIKMKALQKGIIFESHISNGEPVEPNKEMLDIVDLSKIWAVAKVPEAEAATLKPGTKARIKVLAASEKIFSATLLRIGVQADRSTSTIDAIFELDNPDYILRPGMRAEFSFIKDAHKNVLSIPRTAVQGDPTNRFVFVKDFELKNAFIKSQISLGMKNDLYVEVLSGLFLGDEIVTHGSYSLGFAGNSGPSLKEALDAAHGHKHNEDGTKIEEEEKKTALSTEVSDASTKNHSRIILIWAIISTVLLIISLQEIVRRRKSLSN